MVVYTGFSKDQCWTYRCAVIHGYNRGGREEFEWHPGVWFGKSKANKLVLPKCKT